MHEGNGRVIGELTESGRRPCERVFESGVIGAFVFADGESGGVRKKRFPSILRERGVSAWHQRRTVVLKGTSLLLEHRWS
jgi:hypothetical protein